MDIGVAVALGAGLLYADSRSFVTHVGPTASAVRVVGIVVVALAVTGRRPWPRSSFVVATLAAALVAGLGGPPQTSICIAVTAYTAAAFASYPRWWAPPATASLVIAIAVALGRDAGWLAALVGSVAFVCVGWLAGQAAKERRNRLRASADQEAERDRRQRAELHQAAVDERLVIARELHDIVAHSMSVITVRAGVARLVMDTDPGEVKEAMAVIESTTRRALHEMRLLVAILREPPEDHDSAPLAPTPGIADIPRLAEQVRQAGVDLTVHIHGTARALPAGVDLSAYRIVQEALTNVVRHAGPTQATLSIEYGFEVLLIEVTDGGPVEPLEEYPEASRGPAHGLIGMRERVELFGGHLETGRFGSGFRVQALVRTEIPDGRAMEFVQPHPHQVGGTAR